MRRVATSGDLLGINSVSAEHHPTQVGVIERERNLMDAAAAAATDGSLPYAR
jgi:hypothetical protein